MRMCYINLHFTCLLTNRDDDSINIDTVLAADDAAVTCDVAVLAVLV